MIYNYRPRPRWNCNHNWMTIGTMCYVTYTSDSTASIPPACAPKYQEAQCLICGGIADILMQVTEKEAGEI